MSICLGLGNLLAKTWKIKIGLWALTPRQALINAGPPPSGTGAAVRRFTMHPRHGKPAPGAQCRAPQPLVAAPTVPLGTGCATPSSTRRGRRTAAASPGRVGA